MASVLRVKRAALGLVIVGVLVSTTSCSFILHNKVSKDKMMAQDECPWLWPVAVDLGLTLASTGGLFIDGTEAKVAAGVTSGLFFVSMIYGAAMATHGGSEHCVELEKDPTLPDYPRD